MCGSNPSFLRYRHVPSGLKLYHPTTVLLHDLIRLSKALLVQTWRCARSFPSRRTCLALPFLNHLALETSPNASFLDRLSINRGQGIHIGVSPIFRICCYRSSRHYPRYDLRHFERVRGVRSGKGCQPLWVLCVHRPSIQLRFRICLTTT